MIEQDDISFLESAMPRDGHTVSLFKPNAAIHWLENNYNCPLVKSIRGSAYCTGPIAAMLSPDACALTIFGSSLEPSVVRFCRKLASLSKFPVIIRPVNNNPNLTFM